VHVKSLPPTSDSAKFHSLRVYYQCQKWMSETVDIDPTDWGWEMKRGKLCSILMELPPAPEKLLNAIRCNCNCNCNCKIVTPNDVCVGSMVFNVQSDAVNVVDYIKLFQFRCNCRIRLHWRIGTCVPINIVFKGYNETFPSYPINI
jgi:hypothetical protein